jgi:hypothetical protein
MRILPNVLHFAQSEWFVMISGDDSGLKPRADRGTPNHAYDCCKHSQNEHRRAQHKVQRRARSGTQSVDGRNGLAVVRKRGACPVSSKRRTSETFNLPSVGLFEGMQSRQSCVVACFQ